MEKRGETGFGRCGMGNQGGIGGSVEGRGGGWGGVGKRGGEEGSEGGSGGEKVWDDRRNLASLVKPPLLP